MAQHTALIYDPRYRNHRPGIGHPERPERCDAVLAGIDAFVADEDLVRVPPRPATEAEIRLCHTPDYIRIVQEDVQDEVCSLRTGEVDLCPESYDIALLAVGGAITAADLVMTGEARNAFCLVRPPGHHASQACGTGFCIFNNIAIATRHVQKTYGIERVLIVDWDVHHGNGTQDIFYDDPSVLYFSTHQWPLFPGSGQRHQAGTGPGRGFTINCPFPMGSGRDDIFAAFREKLLPAAHAFRPECVFISAGFDGHMRDPLANFCLQARDFYDLTSLVTDIAGAHARERVISVLEGGYDLTALHDAAGAHLQGLIGREFSL
jgi:acetoin utilization deacetylase AcuC-like enzyme